MLRAPGDIALFVYQVVGRYPGDIVGPGGLSVVQGDREGNIVLVHVGFGAIATFGDMNADDDKAFFAIFVPGVLIVREMDPAGRTPTNL